MYQWGRKDPFLGTAWDSERQKPVAITSTLTWPEPVPSDTRFVSQVSYTVSNPTTFITANSINDHWFYLSSLPSEGYGVWYSDLNKKSDFDPCPPGYKVPSVDYQLLSSMNIQNLQWGVDTDAGTLSKDDRPDGWPVVADRAYAFTGYLSEDTGSIVSDRSFYWSCNVYESTLSYRCMEVDKDGYMKRVTTSAPTATILFCSIKTVPFSIIPSSMVYSFPFVKAIIFVYLLSFYSFVSCFVHCQPVHHLCAW